MVSVSVELSDRSVVASVAPERRRGRPMSRGWRRVAAGGSALLFCSAAGSLPIMEAKTSTLQAEVLSPMAATMRYRVHSGPTADRKTVLSGKSVSVRVDLGGRGITKKQIT